VKGGEIVDWNPILSIGFSKFEAVRVVKTQDFSRVYSIGI
jgi:hypothetical protein